MWDLSSVDLVSLAGNTSAVTDLVTILGEIESAHTVIRRILGSWNVIIQSADQDVQAYLGIFVADSDAVAAGALPEPETDNARWLYLDSIALPGGTVTVEQGRNEHKFDLRMNARLGRELQLEAVVQNVQTTSLEYSFWMRILLEVG